MYSTNKNIKTKYTFIEVCAGAGGLSKGFIDSGFTPLLLNDTNKYCIETLKMNHPETNIIKGSMVDLDLEKYKDNNIDVLMGGVPCQSFSQAGKRAGIDDDRGKLIIHFIKMISILSPKMFIIENVQFPQPEVIDDPFFGTSEIYHNVVEVMLNLTPITKGELNGILDIAFQGCWEGGVCYPIVKTSLKLSGL